MTFAVSPWWYRRRTLVIFAIYAVGFSMWWQLPSFLWIARQAHLSTQLLLWIATVFAASGMALRVWGSSYLTPQVVWNRDALQGALLVDGPFRFVRNPLYLGNDLLALGIGVLASPAGWAIIVLGNIAFTAALARHEAEGMRARYGAVYDTYRRCVPAIVPRLTPARVEGSARGNPSLRAGLRAEPFTMAIASALLAYTLTGSLILLWALIVFGWLAQSIVRAQPEPTSAA